MKSIGFNDPNVPSDNFPTYKPTAGRTDRLCILNGGQQIVYEHVHFDQTLKFVVCNSKRDDETSAVISESVCCANLDRADQRFGIVVFHYDADTEGDIINPNKCSGQVKIFTLTNNRYQTLGKIQKSRNIVRAPFGDPQYDILIDTPATDKNRPVFRAADECHIHTNQDWYKRILEVQGEAALETIPNRMGQRLTDAEIREKLGIRSSDDVLPDYDDIAEDPATDDSNPFDVDLDLDGGDDIPF